MTWLTLYHEFLCMWCRKKKMFQHGRIAVQTNNLTSWWATLTAKLVEKCVSTQPPNTLKVIHQFNCRAKNWLPSDKDVYISCNAQWKSQNRLNSLLQRVATNSYQFHKSSKLKQLVLKAYTEGICGRPWKISFRWMTCCLCNWCWKINIAFAFCHFYQVSYLIPKCINLLLTGNFLLFK